MEAGPLLLDSPSPGCPAQPRDHAVGARDPLQGRQRRRGSTRWRPGCSALYITKVFLSGKMITFFWNLNGATVWAQCRPIMVRMFRNDYVPAMTWSAWSRPHSKTIRYRLNSLLFSRLPPIGPHPWAGPHSLGRGYYHYFNFADTF